MKANPIIDALAVAARDLEEAHGEAVKQAQRIARNAAEMAERLAAGGGVIDFVSGPAADLRTDLAKREAAIASLKRALHTAKAAGVIVKQEAAPDLPDYIYLADDLQDDEDARNAYGALHLLARVGLRMMDLEIVPLVSLDAKRRPSL